MNEFLGLARSANLSASKNCGHRKAILAHTRSAVSGAHKFFPGVKKKGDRVHCNINNSTMARAKLMELCGGKSGAGRCDCRGGGGCGVVLLVVQYTVASAKIPF